MTPSAHRLISIDDDPHVADLIRSVAELAGFRTRWASSVEDFWSMWAVEPAEVLVIDLAMPDQDGLELLKALGTRGCKAKVLIMSGEKTVLLDMAKRLSKAYGLTVIGAVQKPVDMKTLLNMFQAAATEP